MRALDLIIKKRDGHALGPDEMRFMVQGCARGEIPDYQISAWLMAIFFRGMQADETGLLTREMIGSGRVIDLSDLTGPCIDKHSTGGVGDKVSLILAPVAAACGLQVPMMSGRSLGHTGGTLDKLESIPGYRTDLDVGDFKRVIRASGFSMIGQSAEVVPADRLLYGLRDVTGTVESVPLITASILSKKFAEGATGLVFDVKCGSGAFMKTREQAGVLARSLVQTASSLGRRTCALITAMDEPLGNKIGNFLEVEEGLDCLDGGGPRDLVEITLELAARMLMLGGLCADAAEGRRRAAASLADGTAKRRFLDNVRAQGGDVDEMLKRVGRWRSPLRRDLICRRHGWVTRVDAYALGLAGVLLGAGRSKAGDAVEPHVGIELFKKAGEEVRPGDLLCSIWAVNEAAAAAAEDLARSAYAVGDEAPRPGPLVLEELASS